MIKVISVAGARPNFMKVAPVHRALDAAGCDSTIVHTGQHYDEGMSQIFFDDLGLERPEHYLGVGSGSHAWQTAEVMARLEPVLDERRPDLVVVVGDVNSTVAGALTARKLDIPVAHVEAGLRSYDRTMPEETNRVVTDVISDLLFAPSRDAVDNLLREGISEEKIHLVGNVMIDSLEALLPAASNSRALESLSLSKRGYFLATLHRPTNVDEPGALKRAVGIFETVGSLLPVVLVAHPRTTRRLEDFGIQSRSNGLRIVEPLGYIDFLQLMQCAKGVLTDSGGIQEETTVLGIPCLTLRENTERPITVTEGTNRVVGLDQPAVFEAAQSIATSAQPTPRRPELWDGQAAQRIAEVITRRCGA
ncbi:MAG: UDP-N-acetylglucosamine 2-epimerase (non-hydrolyzing) [Actinobacteria bacterium]|nr:UDP-N-acetylglucosamine 2-epimerase (non-hydrolyzing) [Actinomycetota bacterium]